MKFRKIKSPATKTIEFLLKETLDKRVYTLPEPANQHVPEWYTEMPEFFDGETNPRFSPMNFTQKNSMRLEDTFNIGYCAVTPYEIEVYSQVNALPPEMRDNPTISVSDSPGLSFAYPGYPIMRAFDKASHYGIPTPNGCHGDAWSWDVWFQIKTPPGYSVLLTNPLNGNTLPWFTSSMVLDSDTPGGHAVPLPFWLRKDCKLEIVPKGTPIFQIIPFKRETWKKDPVIKNTDSVESALETLEAPGLNGYYKKNLWSKKEYN